MSMDHLQRVKPFEIPYFSYDAVLKSLLLVQFSFFQVTNSQFYFACKAWNQGSHFSL